MAAVDGRRGLAVGRDPASGSRYISTRLRKVSALAGIAGIDTASSYGDSEMRMGKWVRKTHKKIRIYSKVGTPEVYGLDEKLTPSKV